jgi:hypothetical protein
MSFIVEVAVVYGLVVVTDSLAGRRAVPPRPLARAWLRGVVWTLITVPTLLLLEAIARALGLSPLGAVIAAATVVGTAAVIRAAGGPTAAPGAGRWLRGAQVLSDARRHFPWRRERVSPETITIGGVAVPLADEPKHFKFIGTTGTGKSTAIASLLSTALARGDRAVIADPDGGYLKRFYDPGRGDVILNPFDARSPVWNPFLELRAVHESADLARSLIGDAGGDEAWAEYARVFLQALLDTLKGRPAMTAEVLYGYVALAPVEMLAELLADSLAAPYLAAGGERMFASLRSVAVTRLAALNYVGRQTGAPFSVREWIETGRGVLFLPYHAGEIAALRQLIAAWLRLAIFQTMQQPDAPRTWFVVDELDALGRIDGLKDALARLRKFEGRCVLGFQSIAQVSGTYGRADAQTIVENCATTLLLRSSAAEGGGTAAFAVRLMGEREMAYVRETRSRTHLTTSVSRQWERLREPVLLSAEIEGLADLSGYLKIPSRPEWHRVTLDPLPRLEARPAHTPGAEGDPAEEGVLRDLPELEPGLVDGPEAMRAPEASDEASLGATKNPAGGADGVL